MRVQILAAVATAALFAQSGNAFAQGACKPKIDHPPLARKGHLLAAINPTVAPIQYVDEDGNIVGLNVDFGNAIAEHLCLKLQLQSMQFATMIPALQDGRFDMIDSFMFYTPERAAQVIMVPYGASSMAVVVPKSDTGNVEWPASFSGKAFGVELGTVDERVAKRESENLGKAGKAPIEVRTFRTYAEVLQALKAGQVAGAFVGTEQAYYYKDKGQDFYRIVITGYEPHAEALAFKDKQLAEMVAGVLNDMKKDGSFDKIFAKYHHCTLPPPYKITTGPMDPPNCPGRPQ
jgi:polar amino acid transport system substrate-binding protein